jgi:hypothetical protein
MAEGYQIRAETGMNKSRNSMKKSTVVRASAETAPGQGDDSLS